MMTRLEALRNEARAEATVYVRANDFLNRLRAHLDDVTRQEFKTLRGQALSGDIAGVEKGLQKIVMR